MRHDRSGTQAASTTFQMMSGSSCSGHAPPIESELSFPNPMQQLDAGNGDRRMSEVLQSQHRPHTPFYPAMILLDDNVEIERTV